MDTKWGISALSTGANLVVPDLFALFLVKVLFGEKFYTAGSALCFAVSLIFFLFLSHSWPNAKFGFDPALYKLL